MIQIEIGIAIEIEKKWDVELQTGCLSTCGQWSQSSAPLELENREPYSALLSTRDSNIHRRF
ncbi:hypothetical protein DSCOOX_32260 [Desulfosarcina ovata subsp. ovata]|uniref:Uncharacterized protein n=1 Tax=Desulfosarcina ovata subsp. ovata TaxID=2752305 RepID=A0A5K8AC09_9BACT|nr:hypothetical protein DSCOOX_32260 [Desulfosarcina ovata subsp. ovata]